MSEEHIESKTEFNGGLPVGMMPPGAEEAIREAGFVKVDVPHTSEEIAKLYKYATPAEKVEIDLLMNYNVAAAEAARRVVAEQIRRAAAELNQLCASASAVGLNVSVFAPRDFVTARDKSSLGYVKVSLSLQIDYTDKSDG